MIRELEALWELDVEDESTPGLSSPVRRKVLVDRTITSC